MNRHSTINAPAFEKFPDFAPGSIWLVGAGPGAPGLMTLLGYHALTRADVVIFDALVNEEILRWARCDAIKEYAGKRGGKPSAKQRDISERLIEFARQNKRVLRLKGGDPFIFGRGGEECEALKAAGIPFRIVPGISAGVGGLAYAGIPITHRTTNHLVTFLTGHDSSGVVPSQIDWHSLAKGSPVIVLYMALKHLGEISKQLIKHGRPADEALAIVSNASLPSQSVIKTTLGGVPAALVENDIAVPAISVIGPVVDLSGILEWYAGNIRENQFG